MIGAVGASSSESGLSFRIIPHLERVSRLGAKRKVDLGTPPFEATH
jgi:hypothetical protein